MRQQHPAEHGGTTTASSAHSAAVQSLPPRMEAIPRRRRQVDLPGRPRQHDGCPCIPRTVQKVPKDIRRMEEALPCLFRSQPPQLVLCEKQFQLDSLLFMERKHRDRDQFLLHLEQQGRLLVQIELGQIEAAQTAQNDIMPQSEKKKRQTGQRYQATLCQCCPSALPAPTAVEHWTKRSLHAFLQAMLLWLQCEISEQWTLQTGQT
mmetsp:Transcript_33058/g.57715  ORF Transcript_33058/g.57715 Transcript_33058/m.57715 type:complete len:206 (+) Transcript_33058:110-727(+)